MYEIKRLVHKNIQRARHSLPFLPLTVRDLISLVPPLVALDEPSFGVYGHPMCSESEHVTLKKYISKPPVSPLLRLPDRVLLETLIAIPRPYLASPYTCAFYIIAIPRKGAPYKEIEEKFRAIRAFMMAQGLVVVFHLQEPPLAPLLVYEIMRVGIMLAGKHPVINTDEVSEASVWIGETPSIIKDPRMLPAVEWNPFKYFLDREVVKYIMLGDYPASLAHIVNINPFLLPYMHILDRYEENMEIEQIEKIRTSLFFLFSSFGPTADVMKEMIHVWNWSECKYKGLSDLSYIDAMSLRKWLVPLEDGELPIVSWPPAGKWPLSIAALSQDRSMWYIATRRRVFSHKYPWVVLVWGVITGLIGKDTKIQAPHHIRLKPNINQVLSSVLEAVSNDVTLLIPKDQLQGSIRIKDKRFFFFDLPFEILAKSKRYIVDLEQEVRKKVKLDDIGLDAFIRKVSRQGE